MGCCVRSLLVRVGASDARLRSYEMRDYCSTLGMGFCHRRMARVCVCLCVSLGNCCSCVLKRVELCCVNCRSCSLVT